MRSNSVSPVKNTQASNSKTKAALKKAATTVSRKSSASPIKQSKTLKKATGATTTSKKSESPAKSAKKATEKLSRSKTASAANLVDKSNKKIQKSGASGAKTNDNSNITKPAPKKSVTMVMPQKKSAANSSKQ